MDTAMTSAVDAKDAVLAAALDTTKAALQSQAAADKDALTKALASASAALTNKINIDVTAAKSLASANTAAIAAAKKTTDSQAATLSSRITDLSNKVNALKFATPAELAASTEAALVGMKTICAVSLGVWVDNVRCEALGQSAKSPARSCRQLNERPYLVGSGAYYIKHPGSATPHRVYCDQGYNGGGWEVLFKVDGSSDLMRYDSGYWTSASNVYRDTDFTANWGVNMKGWGYNYGRYAEMHLRWRDPYDGAQWTWTNPSGWTNTWSPQRYFNTARHICCTRYVNWKLLAMASLPTVSPCRARDSAQNAPQTIPAYYAVLSHLHILRTRRR